MIVTCYVFSYATKAPSLSIDLCCCKYLLLFACAAGLRDASPMCDGPIEDETHNTAMQPPPQPQARAPSQRQQQQLLQAAAAVGGFPAGMANGALTYGSLEQFASLLQMQRD